MKAGADLGFVSREPTTGLKPGPKRKEAQDKVSIPGPKRVVDDFRSFCSMRDLTLWQGLEMLLKEQRRLRGAAFLKDSPAKPKERLVRVGRCIEATVGHPFTPFLL